MPASASRGWWRRSRASSCSPACERSSGPSGTPHERIALGELVLLGRVGHEVEHRPVAVAELARADRPAGEVAVGVGQDARSPDVAQTAEGIGRPRPHAGVHRQREHAVVAEGEI